jgi:hypothetical protein
LRCARCGNENLDGNRFCGMCGATLLSAPAPSPSQRSATGAAIPSAAAIPARSQTAEAPRGSAFISDDSPIISGPSFLGLSDPAPRKRASLSIDPQASRGPKSLDYLLDDEDQHRGSGAGKVLLILVALALAAGLGYLRWKNHGFPSLSSGTNKPSAVAQNPVPTDADSSAPAPAPAASKPVPESQPAANQPASQPAATAQPPADSPSSNDNSAAQPPASKTPTAVAPPVTDIPKSDASKSDTAKPGSAASPATPDTEPPAADTKEPENVASAAAPKNPEKPAPAARQPAPKPSPASVPARISADPVAEAQKYLYGRGAAQDCERGIQILKPAANHSNAKAMIEMGALYSAGLCAPHDLPTAYRWFALALRRDPENQEAQADLQKLWGEMTQPERQLAIKLTQ